MKPTLSIASGTDPFKASIILPYSLKELFGFFFLVPEEELIPPAFIQKPKFQKIEEGTSVTFAAQVVATPKPEVCT